MSSNLGFIWKICGWSSFYWLQNIVYVWFDNKFVCKSRFLKYFSGMIFFVLLTATFFKFLRCTISLFFLYNTSLTVFFYVIGCWIFDHRKGCTFWSRPDSIFEVIFRGKVIFYKVVEIVLVDGVLVHVVVTWGLFLLLIILDKFEYEYTHKPYSEIYYG